MLKISGLYTSFNEHLAPEGSLQVAKNININSPHVAEPRKGLRRLDEEAFPNVDDRAEYLTYFKDKLIIIHDDSSSSGSTLEVYNAGDGLDSLGTIDDTSFPYRSAEANGNLFVTTGLGIRKWEDTTNSSSKFAGGIKAAPLTFPSLVTTGTAINNNKAVAWRGVWGITDSNNNFILGAPSSRVSIDNTSGLMANASHTVVIPDGVTTDHTFFLYRSAEVASGVEPNDNLQLVKEQQPTSGEITAGTMTVTDDLDPSLAGAFLYTSANQEGIGNSNEQPPVAQDIAEFRNSLFFANTRSFDTYNFQFQSVVNLATNDTIRIRDFFPSTTDETYTAKTAENVSNKEFRRVLTSDPEDDVLRTAVSFCNIVNQASDAYYAYYLGDGNVQLVRRTGEATTFYIVASNTTPFLPVTIPTSGITETSSRDRFSNGLYWSKPFEPEGVPLPNQTRVASKDSEIQRIIPLDESLMIFKEDGLYRLTGYYPDFEIELIDASVRLVGKNTPAILNNEIYCLTDQGIVIINATGVRAVISTPIEETIREQLITHYDNMSTYSFGVGREAARRYYLFHPETSADTKATRAYVYNIYTKAWTIHDIEATCGLSNENEFYLGDTDAAYVNQERATGTNRDYADYGFSTTITATADRTITLNSGTDNISAGDILFETSTCYAIITAVDTINSQVTVASNPGFTNTSVDILTAIPTEIKWLPNDYKLPHITKQVHTVTPLFKAGFAGTGYLDFSSDLEPSTESVELAGTSLLGWGISGWGSSPWGDSQVNKPFRQWVPRSKQRCTWLTVGFRHTYGFTAWKLQGIRATYNTGSEKTGR